MTWIKLDDHYDEHPKFAKAGPLGIVLWLAGMAYCNRNLTDGFIPWSTARTLVAWDYMDETGPTRIYIGTRDYVSEEDVVTADYVLELLIDAGLWDEEPGGYRVHDYLDFQPSKAEVMAERERVRGRVNKHRNAKRNAVTNAVTTAVGNGGVTPAPVPVPVPVPSGASNEAPSPVREADPVDVYNTLTARVPKPTVIDWLDRLARDYGADLLTRTMGTQWSTDPTLPTFLGRVENALLIASRNRAAETRDRAAASELEYQRREQERAENATPEEQARAAKIRDGIKDFLKGDVA